MPRRFHFSLGALLMALALVMGSERVASSATIDFEAGEGYSVGDLYGQPSAGNQWAGDDTSKIVVTSAQSQSGARSVLIDPGESTGKVNNDVAVGSVPNLFSLKFYWRPSGIGGGDAVVYLSQFASSETTFMGPWVQFAGGSSVYQIKYVENGTVKNIKLGMPPATYADNWWEVEIIGDISARTFDFYLDGTLEGNDLGFRNTLTNLATGLNYVGLQASVSGSTDHYFDNFQINSNAPPVPTLSEWGLFLLFILLAGTAAWTMRSSLPASQGI